MINGNLAGFGILVLAALIVVIPGMLLKFPDASIMVTVGVVLIVVDMGLRLVNREKEKWLIGDRTGGYLFFIPVWIFGTVVIILNLVIALFVKE